MGFSLIIVILNAVGWYLDPDTSDWIVFFHHICVQLDTIITCVCLTLFMGRTERIYHLVCCCCSKMGYRCLKRALLTRYDAEFSHSDADQYSETSLGISTGALNHDNIRSEPILLK